MIDFISQYVYVIAICIPRCIFWFTLIYSRGLIHTFIDVYMCVYVSVYIKNYIVKSDPAKNGIK